MPPARSYSFVEHLAGAILGARNLQRGLVSIIKVTAYYDASGHEGDDKPFIEMAGIVATADDWAQFDTRWAAALAVEGIAEFHHAAFKASEQQFRDWKGDEDRRRRFMDSLLTVFEDCTKAWYTIGIDKRAFAEVNELFVLDPETGPFLLA